VGLEEMLALPNSDNSQQTTVQSTTQPTTQSTSDSGTTTGQQQSTVTTPPGYVLITQLSALAGKTFEYFNHPNFGGSILVSVNGQWKAFSAICTHRICTVQFRGSSIYCPCHAGTFNPNNGSVTGGPPPSPLPEYSVQILNGSVYVGTSRVN